MEWPLRAGIRKKGAAVGERELRGDRLLEAGAGAGVGSEANGTAVVADAGEATVWDADGTTVVADAEETTVGVASMEVAPRSRVSRAMGGVGRREGRGKRGGEVDRCRAASSTAGWWPRRRG